MAFRIYLSFNGSPWPQLSDKHSGRLKQSERLKVVSAVVPDGREQCICIAVEAEDGLYVTDDFILTHNSALALQAAYTIAGDGAPTLVISDEMSRLMLGKRAIQYSTPINEEAWIHRSDDVLKDVDNHFNERAPIYVVENCGTPHRACESIRRHVGEHGVKCVVVDYMQLLLGKKQNRYEQVTETSLMLKHIATETGVLMIELAQLGREVEKRDTFKPKLSDLRESGQIEGDADVILFLLWPHRIDAKHDPAEYYVFIGKNKNRPTHEHTVKCRFEPSRQKLHVEKPEASMDTAKTSFDYGRDGWDDDPLGKQHELGD